MRTRIRLRDLKAQASDTMNNANDTLNSTKDNVNKLTMSASALMALASDLIEDLADGVKFEIEVKKTGIFAVDAVLESWGWKIPLVLRIDPRD